MADTLANMAMDQTRSTHLRACADAHYQAHASTWTQLTQALPGDLDPWRRRLDETTLT